MHDNLITSLVFDIYVLSMINIYIYIYIDVNAQQFLIVDKKCYSRQNNAYMEKKYMSNNW